MRPAVDSARDAPAAPRDAATTTLHATRLLMWLLVVPVLALLALLTLLQVRQRVEEVERAWLRSAAARALELRLLAQPAIDHVGDLHELLRAAWHEPPDPGPRLKQLLQPRVVGGRSDGYTLDGAAAPDRARFGQFWWEAGDGRPPSEVWLRRAALFNEAARIVHRRDPAFAATWFAAADENTSFGYPWVATATMLAAYGVPTLRAIDTARREGVVRAQVEFDEAPGRLAHWGSPYVSQLDGQLVISHVRKLVFDGRYAGEVSVDFRLQPLQRRIEQWRGEGRVWVVNDAGHVLADAAGALPAPSPPRADTRVHVALAGRLPEPLRAFAGDAAAPGERLQRRGDWLYVTARREGAPWAYVEALPGAALRAQVWPMLRFNALLGAALLFVFVAGQWLLARRFVGPALAVLAYLRGLAHEPATRAPDLGARWQPWLDEVSDTFRTQRELQRRERRTEVFKSAIVDNAVTAIVTTDHDGRIVEFNPMAERMFGVRRDEVVGRVLGDVLVPERHRAAHRAEMARLRAGERIGGVDRPTEMRGLRGDGTEFPLEMLVVPIDFDGQAFYIGFISDLTERRAAAREIERQREALRQSEKLGAMGSLLAGVAHELNNPLAIVMGRASLLEEKTAGTPAADDARRIRVAAERCGRIVRTFLDMARRRPAVREAVQLNHLVRAAAEMLGYTLRSHGIDLELELDAALPPVHADPDQIGQVLLNLVVNAQQALAGVENRRRIVVRTGSSAATGSSPAMVWLRVADTGPGIAPEARARLFEPFFTTRPEAAGSGLGLAVSRTLAREHGGDLVAEAGSGDTPGAVFVLTLPVAAES